MSKHWNPKSDRFGVGRRRPPRMSPGGRRHGPEYASKPTGELRLMLLGGIFLGLAYAVIPAGEVAIADGGAMIEDSWAAVIVDGDTFDYRGQRIRIADIDTPEVKGRCTYESRLAAQATDRMEQLLHAGAFELHAIDRDEDQYGRKLRVVTRGGASLGDQLVAEGLARTWTGRREPWC